MALGATMLTLVLTAATIATVMRGGFGDPDDAMRLVEVRAWLGGQAWFDVGAHRLDPPFGASMHWSRLVDLPTAALIRLFSLAVDTGTAERWTRIVVPSLLLVALYVGMMRLATVLCGRKARGIAVVGTLLSGAALVSFLPGRIGHHAPETVVLIFAVASALASLDPLRAGAAFVSGALVALGLAMSLETLPFLAALCGLMLAAWILRGSLAAGAMASFGAGLGATMSLLFLATIPQGRWLAPVSDAMGAAHLGAGLIFAAGTLVLARADARLRSPARRAAAAAALVVLCFLYVAVLFPTCLRSPFAGVDPLVRQVWLDHVVESKPLLVLMRERPMTTSAIVVPVVLGLVGAVHAAIAARDVQRLRLAAIAALAALGLVLGFWQMRVFTSVTPLALCGAIPLVLAWRDRLERGGLSRAAAFAPLLILPFTSTAWALALPEDAGGTAAAKAACLAPESIAPLAALGAGRTVAPIDLGSHLLVDTSLDVFAAPYHRNDDGNRFMIEVFLAAPEPARALLSSRGVRYVLTCGDETASLAARAPDGLAARLRAGEVPEFLRRLPVAATPYDVFLVAPQGASRPR